MHWETPFELFDPNWMELAQDREQWRHSRYRFVLGELVRLNARNAFGFGARPSPSASIDAARSFRIRVGQTVLATLATRLPPGGPVYTGWRPSLFMGSLPPPVPAPGSLR